MAGEEHQPQDVVLDVVHLGVQVGHGGLDLGLKLVPQLRVLAVQHAVTPEQVDGPALGGPRAPRGHPR